MKLYTEKQVLIKKYVLEKIKCDICKKDIEDEIYYEVTTSHNDFCHLSTCQPPLLIILTHLYFSCLLFRLLFF